MLKNKKVVLFVTLKSWSGRKLVDPTTYVCRFAHALGCRMDGLRQLRLAYSKNLLR